MITTGGDVCLRLLRNCHKLITIVISMVISDAGLVVYTDAEIVRMRILHFVIIVFRVGRASIVKMIVIRSQKTYDRFSCGG